MDKTGEKSWVVVVKATYWVMPDGTTKLADKQRPPLYAAEHLGEIGTSSIRYENDMLPSKSRTDILLNAHAYAPRGEATEAVDVSMTVGPLRKHLRVFGERQWDIGVVGRLARSTPTRFERMPIIYERAFGGWDKTDPAPNKQPMFACNPIGRGFAAKTRRLIGQSLPNVEYPSDLISSCRDRPPPAGFGAIPCYWSPRCEWAGTYDDAWMQSKFPLLPDDFDTRFYQCAPLDQQHPGHLRGGEEVSLVNLTESGHLQFALPKVRLAFTTKFGNQREDHRATLQTVVIEPDVPQVILVWQTQLACHHRLDDLDTTIIWEKRYI